MELKHRGNVRYGEPHLRDHFAGHRFGAQCLAAYSSGVWVAAALLPLIVHVAHDGTISGPFGLESPRQRFREIHDVAVDEQGRVWTRWDGGLNCFDPATEKFDSFPSDMAGANVRQLAGKPGEVWGGESGTNRLVRIQTVA